MMRYLVALILLYSSLQSIDIYFDTPNLHLLNNNAVLKYQIRENNETIIYASATQKTHIYEVKHYKKVKFIEEKHPLLSLIKRKDRASFINILKNDGIKYPMKLKHIFTTSIPIVTLSENNISRYERIYNIKNSEDLLFNIKFKYPYFVNLLSAILFSLVGLLFVYILRKWPFLGNV